MAASVYSPRSRQTLYSLVVYILRAHDIFKALFFLTISINFKSFCCKFLSQCFSQSGVAYCFINNQTVAGLSL